MGSHASYTNNIGFLVWFSDPNYPWHRDTGDLQGSDVPFSAEEHRPATGRSAEFQRIHRSFNNDPNRSLIHLTPYDSSKRLVREPNGSSDSLGRRTVTSLGLATSRLSWSRFRLCPQAVVPVGRTGRQKLIASQGQTPSSGPFQSP